MLDFFLLRNDLNTVIKKLSNRGFKLDVDKFLYLEQRRKVLQIRTENLQAERNAKSKSIGKSKICKENTENIESSRLEINKLNFKLNEVKSELELLQSEILNIVLAIPNLPDKSVPVGEGKSCNIEVKRWGIPRKFNFKIRDHVTLGEMHDGLDFSSAVKITGSRFVVMKGQIAHLHRALIQFMLDLHTEQHGYKETYIPYLVNDDTLYGTGQLPKFANDLFHTCLINEKKDKKCYALIPTAEVPLTNLVRNEILDEDSLPIKLTAHSPCFRSEAGSYGRDTRGLTRMHQFDKVEMVQIVRPEDSMNALEEMTAHAEKILELLNLPYRRMILCTGDMSFSACKTYDLEVWIPTRNEYYEISSCSNIWDFQARRMKARFRSKSDKKIRLVHTLNGSGLAISRTLVAILENFQKEDGRIELPDVLLPYMKGQRYISSISK